MRVFNFIVSIYFLSLLIKKMNAAECRIDYKYEAKDDMDFPFLPHEFSEATYTEFLRTHWECSLDESTHISLTDNALSQAGASNIEPFGSSFSFHESRDMLSSSSFDYAASLGNSNSPLQTSCLNLPWYFLPTSMTVSRCFPSALLDHSDLKHILIDTFSRCMLTSGELKLSSRAKACVDLKRVLVLGRGAIDDPFIPADLRRQNPVILGDQRLTLSVFEAANNIIKKYKASQERKSRSRQSPVYRGVPQTM